MRNLFRVFRMPETKAELKSLMGVLSFVVSVLFMATLLVDYGFTFTQSERHLIQYVYNFTWLFFILLFTYRVIFDQSQIARKSVLPTVVVGLLLYLSALPKIFYTPDTGGVWLWLWQLFDNKYFVSAILMLLSMTEISRGVVSFINKKTNPALLITAGFGFVVLVGTILLLLPRSTHQGISVVNALFVSTSAVCVTGLTPVDVALTFTTEGQVVIALLVQIGGLGVMTLTSFFALFFMGSTGLYNQFALRDMMSTDTISSLVSMLLYILGFTFAIELIGALLIWASIHSTMGMTLHDELFFSLFHAVSAFCNAGFSTLSGNLGNQTIMTGHNFFYVVISTLIVLGGIGFPILVNFKEGVLYHLKFACYRYLRRGIKPARLRHLTNVNTKIVLVTSSALIIGGTLFFVIFEWNGAFAGMSSVDKFVHALFNAISPRTAGFNSVDITRFSMLTIVFSMFLMWVGGASQSTAGGIKVNTFAVALSNFISVVRGHDRVDLFGRELTPDSVRRASATIFGSIVIIIVFVFALIAMQPGIPPLHLLFETISAIGTVGLSLNTTPLLNDGSKVLVALIMFVGRVGLITILMGVIAAKGKSRYRFPKDKVIIN